MDGGSHSPQELVLARVDRLELLQLRLQESSAGVRNDVGQLQVVAAVPVDGTVTGLHAFRPYNSQFEYIIGTLMLLAHIGVERAVHARARLSPCDCTFAPRTRFANVCHSSLRARTSS